MDMYVGFEFEVETNIKKLINNTHKSGIIKCKYAYICDYHRNTHHTNRGFWRIEKDASLYNGAEFISPPEKYEQAIKTMKLFLNAVEKNKATTSKRCGCHINISLTNRGKILKINEDDLFANINWRLMYFLWGNRLLKSNMYCRNLNSIFTQLKNNSDIVYTDISNKTGIGKELLSKPHACIVKKVNLMSNTGHYYELRFPGGRNYHKHPDKIEQTIRHFNEVLEKSRKSYYNKKINKKIISYINRLNPIRYTWPELLKRKTALPSTIKILANTYQKQNKYKHRMIRTLTNSVTNALSNNCSFINKSNITKLRSTVCRNHLFYYFLKYAFFSYDNNENYISYNPISRFINTGITLTIPKEESDFNKLWLASVYFKVSRKEQIHIIRTIKSNKAKIIFKKMLKNKEYKNKIINAQKHKKELLNDKQYMRY